MKTTDKYIKLAADGLVKINTVDIGSVAPGDLLLITVENTNGDQVGLLATNWVIGDTEISINGVISFYAYAEDSKNIEVVNSLGDPVGIINGLSQFEIGDSNIRNSDSSYNIDVPATTNLVLPDVSHTDSDLSPVILPMGTPMICSPATGGTTPVSNSDDSYVSTVTHGVHKELPDVTMTQPNGSTTNYPSVKDFSCTSINSLDNSDLISQITDSQLVALYQGRVNINVVVLTTLGAQNYSKPANLLWVDVICVGGGGGGASGQRRPAPSASQGGAGGGMAAIARRSILASDLAGTEIVTVGAGGAGGVAQTVDNSPQIGGSVGGSTSFGSLVLAVGGNGGANGSNSAAAITPRTSCVPTTSQLNIQGGAASTGGTTGAGGNAVVMAVSSSLIGYGGAGGGALSAANPGNEAAGGQGSRIYNNSGALSAVITGGVASGGNGNDGIDNWALQIQLYDQVLHAVGIGSSGSGGGSENSGTAGRGGNGGLYGAGGGGGGGSRYGFNSGAGGNGAQGLVLIYEFLV